MNDIQLKVVELLDAATPKRELKKWGKGYIPKHYKKLSIPMDEAIELAEEGFADVYAYFDVGFYFTQSMIYGAVLSGRYFNYTIVTPSQYGKSYTLAHISIRRAADGHKVYVAGADADVSDIIMSHVMSAIQTANEEIRGKLISVTDKIEKLEIATSKKLLGFIGGGRIEGITLGENFNNKKTKNKAIGRGGDFIVDEASMISSDTRAEMGRSEFADKSGNKFLNLEISNPHNPGEFMDDLMSDEIADDHLVIWMDARTALEEGNYKSKEQIIESKFFKNKSTCKRYLLCELEDYSESSLFPDPTIDDSDVLDDYEYYLGVDSAYKGKDGIEAVLSAIDEEGHIRVLDHITIEKGKEWIDGITSLRIIEQLMRIITAYNVKMVCVDVGKGIWLVEGLSQRAEGFAVKGIDFGSGATNFRKKAGHYAAVTATNKRAEMHLDLQDLMEPDLEGKSTLSLTSKMAEALKDQMNAVKGIRKGQGAKTAIIPKDDIKIVIGKSPDELDATILSVHALLINRMTEGLLLYQDE